MRTAVAILALAISQIGLTVCQATCAADHQRLLSTSTCHEAMPDSGGPSLAAVLTACHPDAGGSMGVAPKSLPIVDVSVGRAGLSSDNTAALRPRPPLRTIPPSPSPPLLPLRL